MSSLRALTSSLLHQSPGNSPTPCLPHLPLPLPCTSTSQHMTLRSIKFTCVFIARKNINYMALQLGQHTSPCTFLPCPHPFLAKHLQEMTLRSIQITCVFIASKNIDRIGTPALLRCILSKIYGGVPVPYCHAYEVSTSDRGVKGRGRGSPFSNILYSMVPFFLFLLVARSSTALQRRQETGLCPTAMHTR